jgi:2-keto-3-deoxygluconate permease
MADPTYAAIAPLATIQVAASVIVTAILTPILTSWMYKKVQKERAEKGIVVDAEEATSEAKAA